MKNSRGDSANRLRGVSRFTSTDPKKKIYGRLDFMSGFKQHSASKTLLKPKPSMRHLEMLPDIAPRSTRISRNHSELNTPTNSRYDTPLRNSLDLKHKNRRYSNTINPEHPNSQFLKSEIIKKTFDYHDPKRCLCNQCSCGRHLCQFHVYTPSMQIDSIYRQSYAAQKPTTPLAFKPAPENSSKFPTVDLVSTYLGDYVKRNNPKPPNPIPEDNLKFQGPISTSSYKKDFPGHHGDNQYVKPTNKHYLQGLQFDGSTIYKKSYLPRVSPTSSLDKIDKRDSLKNLSLWLGNSSYRDCYKEPQDKYYVKNHVKRVQDRDMSPDSHSRFETIYRNEFNQKPTTVCLAKILMQSSHRGHYEKSKGRLIPNADYKAASPHFQALSLTKQ